MKIKIKEKFNVFIRANRRIGILLDSIEGFFIVFIIITLIVFFASSIIHNIFRIIEVSNEYNGKYKRLYDAGDGMINLYTEGNGDKTIIILPSLGTVSPVIEYKALADSLSTSYKVVIAEPLGYGYSLSTKKDRNSKNIVSELKDGLDNAKISGPYTLLTFSNSSLYADYYAKQYPEELNGIITVNPVFPESLNNESFKNQYLPNVISNIRFYSIVSFSGLFRWKSYVYPQEFKIDKMQANGSYGKEEIRLYRNRLANRFLTKEMRKESTKLKDNMEELIDFKYADNLVTLQIVTTAYRDEYLQRQENISKYATNLITNKEIQKIRTIEGDLDNYLFSYDGIRDLKNLINMYF